MLIIADRARSYSRCTGATAADASTTDAGCLVGENRASLAVVGGMASFSAITLVATAAISIVRSINTCSVVT